MSRFNEIYLCFDNRFSLLNDFKHFLFWIDWIYSFFSCINCMYNFWINCIFNIKLYVYSLFLILHIHKNVKSKRWHDWHRLN